MAVTLSQEDIQRLIANKPPVNTLGELDTRYPEGGQLGWFAYVSQLGAFAVWNGTAWEVNKSSDASGQYASMALAAQAAAEAALTLIQTIGADVELSAGKAEAYAITPEDIPFEGEYSALHYAAKAAAAKMSIDQIKSELQSDKQTVAIDKDIVLNAKQAVKEAETNVLNNAATVGQKTVEATNAAAVASQLASGLSEAEQNAKDYRDAAYQHYLGASNKAVEASGHSESARLHKEVSISKASEASDSADAAASSAAIAGDKATLALSASTQAGLHRNAAEASETNAGNSATTAGQAKTAAESARDESVSAKNLAEQAKTAAETAKTGAEAARDKAMDWAEKNEDSPVETGKYSAKHYSLKAEEYASQFIPEQVRSQATNKVPSSKLLDDELTALENAVDAAKTDIENMTMDFWSEIDVEMLTSIIEGAYIPNGVLTANPEQTTFFCKVIEGLKFNLNITPKQEPSILTIRWGFYNSIPILGAQAVNFGQHVEATKEFTSMADGYFAFSLLNSGFDSFEIKTIGKLSESVAEISGTVSILSEIIGEGLKPIPMINGYYKIGDYDIGTTFNDIIFTSETYKCGKISCKEGDKFRISATGGATSGVYNFTNAEMVVLERVINTTLYEKDIVAPVNSAFLHICDNSNSTSYVGEPNELEKISSEISSKIDNANKRSNFSALKSDFSLTSSAMKKLPELFVRKNSRLSITVGAFTSIRFGLGYNGYMGYWIDVNDVNVSVYQYLTTATLITSYPHGLNITGGINIAIKAELETASIIIIDSFGALSKTDDVPWWGGGAAFVTNLGASSISGTISYFPDDIRHRIWMFGDSYFSYNQLARWPYYLLDWNFNKWLANHQPGVNTPPMIDSLNTLTTIGTPKYIVWCLGMNDASDIDSSTPNPSWMSGVQSVVSYCEENGVVPIFATIPTTSNDDLSGLKYNEGKNNWVRNSGHRYIDFAKAVGATPSGTWLTGLKAADIHPSVLGAKVLAGRVLVDFPEIMQL